MPDSAHSRSAWARCFSMFICSFLGIPGNRQSPIRVSRASEVCWREAAGSRLMRLPVMTPGESGDLDIACLFALGAGGDVEAHPLAFGQRLEALALNC